MATKVKCEKYRVTRKQQKELEYAKIPVDENQLRAWVFEGFHKGSWYMLGREYIDEKCILLENAISYRVDKSKTFRPEQMAR